jgi:hypothetical protein
MVETTDTATIARRYFEAWTTRATEAAAAMLAEDFRFVAGDLTVEGRDAFLDLGAFPRDAVTTMVARPTKGASGFQTCDTSRHEVTVRIVEQLPIRDGTIVESVFVTDMNRGFCE